MIRATIATVLLLLFLATKQWLVAPPEVSGNFDGVAAKARLERILDEGVSHSVDTAANDRVRERIVAELRSFGLEDTVRRAALQILLLDRYN